MWVHKLSWTTRMQVGRGKVDIDEVAHAMGIVSCRTLFGDFDLSQNHFETELAY